MNSLSTYRKVLAETSEGVSREELLDKMAILLRQIDRFQEAFGKFETSWVKISHESF